MDMTSPDVDRCGALVRTCPVKRGGCGYRYTKDDKGLEACPHCGTDRHCTVPVGAPGRRCNVHGGKSQLIIGAASPSFKTGLYSKDLPTRLAAQYQAAMDDPELLGLRSGIALLEVRLGELLTRVDVGGGEAELRKVATEFRAVQAARSKIQGAILARNVDRMAEALDELGNCVDKLGAAIDQAQQDYGIWHDIQDVLQDQRALKDSERRRLVDMQTMMSPESGLSFIGTLEALLKKNINIIPEPYATKFLRAVAKDFRETFDVGA